MNSGEKKLIRRSGTETEQVLEQSRIEQDHRFIQSLVKAQGRDSMLNTAKAEQLKGYWFCMKKGQVKSWERSRRRAGREFSFEEILGGGMTNSLSKKFSALKSFATQPPKRELQAEEF